MGTRGLYGFRKNGIDKLNYNHWDSYPSWLGKNVLEFCKNHHVIELNQLYDNIIIVREQDKPTQEQIYECLTSGLASHSDVCSENVDWYSTLYNCRGKLDMLAKAYKDGYHVYMTDNRDFIKDSLFCEYAYIINLDDGVLEYYEGFQHKPQINNRYGTQPFSNGYYPCRLYLEIPLNEINNVDEIIYMMETCRKNEEEDEE